jgi:hypothetical protein
MIFILITISFAQSFSIRFINAVFSIANVSNTFNGNFFVLFSMTFSNINSFNEILMLENKLQINYGIILIFINDFFLKFFILSICFICKGSSHYCIIYLLLKIQSLTKLVYYTLSYPNRNSK